MNPNKQLVFDRMWNTKGELLYEKVLFSNLKFRQRDWTKGKLTSEYYYLDMQPLHQKVGVHRKWHLNGVLRVEVNYKKGLKHGVEKVWSSNGDLESKSRYKNGILKK